MSITRLNVSKIVADVKSGKTSAAQIAADVIARVEAYDAVQPQVWISRVAPEALRVAAKAVDARIKAGESLPLAGVPFAVKDNIDVAGMETTAACPAFAHVPKVSAKAVDLLIEAGALLVGKTNLDQFATGLVGTRSPYGAPHCVFNADYISGGSSSGSAVATGAGLVAFALGTDTAGSGRVPAAINHLIGLKPTRGRWSTSGVLPACRSLDCISVFAEDVAGAGLVDSVLNAFDAADIYSREPQAHATAKVLRLGVPKPEQLNFCGDAESAKLFDSAVERAKAAGAQITTIDIAPLLACAQLLYQGAFVAERTAALREFTSKNAASMNVTVRGIVQGGQAYSAADAYDAEYKRLDYMRYAEAMWREVDALLLPTAPTTYRIAELQAEPVALNSNMGIYTNFVNLLDMSAIAVPGGFRDNGTGFGVTFIGPAWSDHFLLETAQKYLDAGALFEMPALALEPKPSRIKLAVVGAHLNGMPLHWQLTSRNARLVKVTKTAPSYKLYAMANSTPPKPALVHEANGGASIAVEVYELEEKQFGSFTAEVPPPLAIGSVTLEDGETVKGFVSEPRALTGAVDITHLGGWRAYIAQLNKA